MQNSRRKLLSLVSATPLVTTEWVSPVVSSIVLPAHAQTSCSVPAGCYEFTIQGQQHFAWPGGSGVQDVDLYVGPCSDGDQGEADGEFIVLTTDQETATELLPECGDPEGQAFELPVTASLPAGCNFYICD